MYKESLLGRRLLPAVAFCLAVMVPTALVGQGAMPPAAHDSAHMLPMTRMGSGTSWLPDATAMHGLQFGAGGWEFMADGVIFATYDRQQGGPRSDAEFGSQNWGMLMADHRVGVGRLEFRGMLSAEPWTVTGRGYPLLLQSGEAYDGVALHDRQHPHNLFVELAAEYQTRLTKGIGLDLYAGPAGEPAVGPVAFPHRPSASSDPFAPLGHHWQDATHVTYGVITAGLFTSGIKLEGSVFNGREPDQNRTDFDLTTPGHPTLDSYSGRLTANPAPDWSISSWYAYLRSPEQLEPTVSQHRMGASILNGRPFGVDGQWSSALIYGANLYSNDARLSNSVLLETNVDLDRRNTVFGRIEYVNKSPADLDVPVPTAPAADRFDIESVSVGYVRAIGRLTKYAAVGVGAVVILDAIPASLEPAYHTRTPYGFGLFVRARPSHGGGGTMGRMSGMQMRAGP